MRKVRKPSSSRPILIYFEFRSKPSLITVICMDPHSPNKLFATKYCFLMLGDNTSFFFFISLFFVSFFCYFTLLLIFTKIILLLLFYYIFFSWKLFLFFHVPGCSGMFLHVPECSVFRVLSTPIWQWLTLILFIDLLPPPLPPRHFTMPAHPCNSYRSLAWT